MSDSPTQFTGDSAQRIAAAVRAYERQGGRTNHLAPRPTSQAGGFYAKLNGENPYSPGFYSWTMQQITNGMLEDSADPVVQDTDYTASEFHGVCGLPAGSIAYLRFAGYDGDAPRYLFAYSPLVLVSIGASQGNGTYNGSIMTGQATDANLAGMSSGADCLIINGPEFDNGSTQLNPTNYAPGMIVGTDGDSKKPLVVITSFAFAACGTYGASGS